MSKTNLDDKMTTTHGLNKEHASVADSHDFRPIINALTLFLFWVVLIKRKKYFQSSKILHGRSLFFPIPLLLSDIAVIAVNSRTILKCYQKKRQKFKSIVK